MTQVVVAGIACLTALGAYYQLDFGQLDFGTSAVGDQLADQIAATDWLGPMAPIALSPFFGLTMMSGLATYGPEWLGENSSLLAHDSRFASPVLFWTMLCLSVASSLPRLSKVSKPLALACESLETYSSIIILIVIRFCGSTVTGDLAADNLTASHTAISFAQAGLPMDILVSLAVFANIVVVNAVKLFFEFAIWLVPFPTIDAILEAANKLFAAALMAVYCFSPLLATGLNLTILFLSALVFGWVTRLSRKYRELVCGPALAWLAPKWFGQKAATFRGFLTTSKFGLPKHTRLDIDLRRNSPTRWTVVVSGHRWLKRVKREFDDVTLAEEPGLVSVSTVFSLADGDSLQVVHRRWVPGDALYSSSSTAPLMSEPAS